MLPMSCDPRIHRHGAYVGTVTTSIAQGEPGPGGPPPGPGSYRSTPGRTDVADMGVPAVRRTDDAGSTHPERDVGT
jgi:hypothetical protein